MQQVVCEDTVVALTHRENMERIQEKLTEHEYTNEPQENNTNIQNFFQTLNEKHHVQDVANLDCDVKYMSTVTDHQFECYVNVLNKSKRENFNFKAGGRYKKREAILALRYRTSFRLAERGLPFREDNEKFGTPNNGNYFGLLELVAKFDPFLRDPIDRYENTDSGKPSYLSKITCEEIIQLTANKMKDTIMAEVKKAGCFSFSVDSTPDISHTDQFTLIIRYVSPEDGLPIERFLTFLELKDHSG
ncbi:zinc finger MYM-type protein 1 [Caerostris darwini]|uniref:Zinc finger MYM-type protein 1 n=1 Tax=Caerostris darwini TaxID=1538125 RepID=A0AAV4QFU6_9ARAC|nr:zinc finger MYM-type protein 1 [Caerostris darwini]